MKEMIYDKHLERLLLDSGSHFGYNYFILNLGTHPTAYVEIPVTSKLYNKHYDDINIDVHGGLTYSADHLDIGDDVLKGWFIGWDYAHYNDYLGFEDFYLKEFKRNSKKWTTEEIQKEVYSVCKQLRRIDNMNKDIKLQKGDILTYRFPMKGSTIINTVNGWNGLSIKEFENKSSYKVLKLERPQTIYEFKEILDEKEKEYLSAVIRPFKGRVDYIQKEISDTREDIVVCVACDDYLSFPYFEKGTMYKGMELGKKYTLKELGLE